MHTCLHFHQIKCSLARSLLAHVRACLCFYQAATSRLSRGCHGALGATAVQQRSSWPSRYAFRLGSSHIYLLFCSASYDHGHAHLTVLRPRARAPDCILRIFCLSRFHAVDHEHAHYLEVLHCTFSTSATVDIIFHQSVTACHCVTRRSHD